MTHYFPDEIIREILFTLPVKSLVRFTCANKSWCSIIKSPTFASAHLAHTNASHDRDRLLILSILNTSHTIVTACLDQINAESFTDLRFPYKGGMQVEMVGSCNGLLFLKHHINILILWNPSIRKFVRLPKPQNTECEDYMQDFLGWGFSDYMQDSIGWGFGFDSRTNDYKVVKISGMKVNHHVQVFSLTAGSWKSSIRVGAPLCRFRSRGEPRPFINGAIHWLTITKTDDFHITVLSFDVSNETFHEIILPKETEVLFPCPMLFSITVYENSLAVRVGGFASFSLWVMKEYGAVESWTKLLTLELNIPVPLSGFGFTKRGELVWKGDSGEVVSYDPKSKKFMSLGVKNQGCYCFVDSFEESVVLLNQANLAEN